MKLSDASRFCTASGKCVKGVRLLSKTNIPTSPGISKRSPVCLATQKTELSAIHAELMKEIEERKQVQAELLKKLSKLTEKAGVSGATPSGAQNAKPQPTTAPATTTPSSRSAAPSRPASEARTAPKKPSAPSPFVGSSAAAPPKPSLWNATGSPSSAVPSPSPASPSRPSKTQPSSPSRSAAPPATSPSDILTRSLPSPAAPTAILEPPASRRILPPETTLEEPEKPTVPKEEPPLAGPNVMKIVMVGAECAPWSKTGGLGDVMGALPKGFRRRGHRMMVVAPRYGNYPDVKDTGARARFNCFNQVHEVSYWHTSLEGVDFVFVDHPSFHRGNDIYGGSREELLFRCSLLSKAALEAVWHVPCDGTIYGDDNLCFLANDWHTALLPVYLQAHYRDYGQMTFARCVFVIHNMAHQGRGPFDETRHFELNDTYKEMFRMYDPVGGEHMNIMKMGIQTAHQLVAVSKGYAWECVTPEGGWGLHQVLTDSQWKLRGIVNGIDYSEWSPEADAFLKSDGYVNYSLDNMEEGKRQCKMALQKELGLPVDPNIPLLGFIGRLDYQKGVDLIRDSNDWLMAQGVQLVMLGSGREDLENDLRAMENNYKDQCRGWVGFSVKVAHRITAGCDILLMPSRFEPCGLNQLYAMAYGTIPVVHAVGGLRDTVIPFNPFENTGTGWTFECADAHEMRSATYAALDTYHNHPTSFRGVALRGMEQDLSWDHAAEMYEQALVTAKYQW